MSFTNRNPSIRNDLFSFTKTPFLQAPKQAYLNEQRKQYLNELQNFSKRRGIAAIAGEPGSGKTALLRYFTESLSKNDHKIIYNPHMNTSDNDLLRILCNAFDIEAFFHRNKTIKALEERFRELGSINPIVVLDEIQNSSHKLLETIRLLSNSDFDSNNRLTIVLIGTEDLFRELKKKINESLRQRITLYCRMESLTENESFDYVRHCLSQAGADHEIFKAESLKLMHDISRGRMRILNKLAISSLESASAELSPTVELRHIQYAEEICILPKSPIMI